MREDETIEVNASDDSLEWVELEKEWIELQDEGLTRLKPEEVIYLEKYHRNLAEIWAEKCETKTKKRRGTPKIEKLSKVEKGYETKKLSPQGSAIIDLLTEDGEFTYPKLWATLKKRGYVFGSIDGLRKVISRLKGLNLVQVTHSEREATIQLVDPKKKRSIRRQ